MGLFWKKCQCEGKITDLERQYRAIQLEFEKLHTHVVSLRNQWNATSAARRSKSGGIGSESSISLTKEEQDFIQGLPEWEKNEVIAKLKNLEND